MGGEGGWVKLLECEMIKPSGRPLGNNTLEDEEVALAGHEFTFPLDAPPVRYLRFKILETWGGTDYMWIRELTFFGQQKKNQDRKSVVEGKSVSVGVDLVVRRIIKKKRT